MQGPVEHPIIMRRIYQQLDPSLLDSDCLGACVASVTGLSVNDLPILRGRRWFHQLQEWLFVRGYQTTMSCPSVIDSSCHIAIVDPYMHPEGEWRCHAIVYKGVWPIHNPAEHAIQTFSSLEHQVLNRISIRPLNLIA